MRWSQWLRVILISKRICLSESERAHFHCDPSVESLLLCSQGQVKTSPVSKELNAYSGLKSPSPR